MQPQSGGRSHPKLNIATRPIAKKYCEGKVKRTLKRGSKALEIVKRKPYATVDRRRGSLPTSPLRRLRMHRHGGPGAPVGGAPGERPSATRRRRSGGGEKSVARASRGSRPGERSEAARPSAGPGSRGRAPPRGCGRTRTTGDGGTRAPSSRGRRREGPARPVLKHGPRSLTRTRVLGRETRGRSESETGERGRPRIAGRSLAGGVESERSRWDPKDGELSVSRTKPEETPVEVRSDTDVQIVRLTCV